MLPAAAAGTPIREVSADRLRRARRLQSLLAGREQEELHVGEGESTLAITGSALGGREGGSGALDPRHLRARAPGADEGRVRAHRVARAAQPADLGPGLRRAADAGAGQASAPSRRRRSRSSSTTRATWSACSTTCSTSPARDAGRLTIRPVPTEVGAAGRGRRADDARPDRGPKQQSSSRGRGRACRRSTSSPTGSARSSSTCSPTRTSTAQNGRRSGSRPRASATKSSWPSPTTGRGFPRSSSSTSSTASRAATPASPSGSAAPGSGWRSRSRWSSCTGARSARRRPWARAPHSASSFRPSARGRPKPAWPRADDRNQAGDSDLTLRS